MLEQVSVDGLRTGSEPLFIWGAVYDRVVLKGKLDKLVLSSRVNAPGLDDVDQQAFDAASKDFYASVDWAIDIREVEVHELDIRGVPSRLVRRDTRTQAVVRRENALDEKRWRDLDLGHAWWATQLESMVREGHEEIILVAPLRNRKVADFITGIEILRNVGVADSE
jgi:hypothetical protein